MKSTTSRPGLGHCPQSPDERRRALTGKAAEVPHHMHLVVVTKLLGDVRPAASRRHHLRLKRRIEPDDPRVALGRQTNLLDKPSLKLSNAHPGARSRVIYAKRAMLQKQSIGGRGDGIGYPPVSQMPQQEVGRDSNAFLKTRCLGEPLFQLRYDGADDGLRVVGTVSQVGHRYTKELVESRRLEVDGEHVEATS